MCPGTQLQLNTSQLLEQSMAQFISFGLLSPSQTIPGNSVNLLQGLNSKAFRMWQPSSGGKNLVVQMQIILYQGLRDREQTDPEAWL